MSDYIVTVRGPIPPDLARRVAEAHAQAIRARAKHLEGQPAPVIEAGQERLRKLA